MSMCGCGAMVSTSAKTQMELRWRREAVPRCLDTYYLIHVKTKQISRHMAYHMQRSAEWDQGKTRVRVLYGETAMTQGSAREVCNGALSPRIRNVSLWR